MLTYKLKKYQIKLNSAMDQNKIEMYNRKIQKYSQNGGGCIGLIPGKYIVLTTMTPEVLGVVRDNSISLNTVAKYFPGFLIKVGAKELKRLECDNPLLTFTRVPATIFSKMFTSTPSISFTSIPTTDIEKERKSITTYVDEKFIKLEEAKKEIDTIKSELSGFKDDRLKVIDKVANVKNIVTDDMLKANQEKQKEFNANLRSNFLDKKTFSSD